MSDRELRVNVYNSSKVGHTNVSFYEDGHHVYTVGANVLSYGPGLVTAASGSLAADDGIYRDESADHLAAVAEGSVVSAAVPVTEDQYDDLLEQARALEGQSFDYGVFTDACVELVDEFYAATEHPGEVGDLFAEDDRTGSLVWARMPITPASLIISRPETVPYYSPEPLPPPLDPPPPELASIPDQPLPADPASLASVDEPSPEHGFDRASLEEAATGMGTDQSAASLQGQLSGASSADLTFGSLEGAPAVHDMSEEDLSFGPSVDPRAQHTDQVLEFTSFSSQLGTQLALDAASGASSGNASEVGDSEGSDQRGTMVGDAGGSVASSDDADWTAADEQALQHALHGPMPQSPGDPATELTFGVDGAPPEDVWPVEDELSFSAALDAALSEDPDHLQSSGLDDTADPAKSAPATSASGDPDDDRGPDHENVDADDPEDGLDRSRDATTTATYETHHPETGPDDDPGSDVHYGSDEFVHAEDAVSDDLSYGDSYTSDPASADDARMSDEDLSFDSDDDAMG